MKRILLLFISSLLIGSAMAQTSIKGKVTDENGGIPGANVFIDSKTGTITDLDGSFTLNTSLTGEQTVTISFIGYQAIQKTVTLNGNQVDLGAVSLTSSDIGLDEIQVVASYVESSRETPIAVSTINTEDIEEKLASQEFPEILKTTPGVYTTKQGGGFGDARINVRGFDQRNTAVLINGIPVNDMENGWVFWSNWAGLSDATKAMQVQRGLGASKLAINSVGGTINIITKTTDAEKGGILRTSIGNNGYRKTMMTLSTGLMEGGWAVTVAGSRTTGDGYIDGTFIDAWSYFASIAKSIGDNHQLVFTAIGAPQEHGQRTDNRFFGLNDEKYDGHASEKRYNPDWGYYDGQVLHERRNFYHKPQMALNHYWDISDAVSLNTSAYASFGRGGGTGTLSPTDFMDLDGDGRTDDGISFFTSSSAFRTSTGQVDWEAVRTWNQGGSTISGKTNPVVTVNGEDAYLSGMILRASMNDHNWYGVLSTLSYDINENLSLIAGVDLRSYKGIHYRKVVNLLGGDYYYDDDDVSVGGRFTKVGDKVNYDNDGLVRWQGGFTQLEYKNDQFSAFLAGSVSNISYKRVDRFQYDDSDPLKETDWESFIGYNAKAGVNYNLNEHHNVYVNGGMYSRAPGFDNVFPGNQSVVASELVNEKVMAAEVGYGITGRSFSANLNAYYTLWQDRNFTQSVGRSTAIISGQDALHTGIELDLLWQPVSQLMITGMASIGDWQWKNDVNATIVDENDPTITQDVTIYADGLKVGDAAQTTLALGLKYDLNRSLYAGLDFLYAADLFANYDPSGRADETDRGQAWELPDYATFDLRMGYKFDIAGMKASVLGNVNNLFDKEYIAEGEDGARTLDDGTVVHDQDAGRYFYGFGRTWTASLRLEF